jgi:hypothetical protein
MKAARCQPTIATVNGSCWATQSLDDAVASSVAKRKSPRDSDCYNAKVERIRYGPIALFVHDGDWHSTRLRNVGS